MNIKSKSLLLAMSILFMGAVSISACKKTSTAPASIIGAWTISSVTSQIWVNHVMTYDTTASYPASVAFTFGSDGFFTQTSSGGVVGGAYMVNSNTLALFDTIGGLNTWLSVSFSNLGAHTLTLIDTPYKSTDTVELSLENFSR